MSDSAARALSRQIVEQVNQPGWSAALPLLEPRQVCHPAGDGGCRGQARQGDKASCRVQIDELKQSKDAKIASLKEDLKGTKEQYAPVKVSSNAAGLSQNLV
jgi:hypothetical protein